MSVTGSRFGRPRDLFCNVLFVVELCLPFPFGVGVMTCDGCVATRDDGGDEALELPRLHRRQRSQGHARSEPEHAAALGLQQAAGS